MKFHRLFVVIGLFFWIEGCQQNLIPKSIEVIFPSWVTQTQALEKAFESGGILLKIIVEAGKAPRKATTQLLRSVDEMNEISLPVGWFQAEGLLKLEVQAEWGLGEGEQLTKSFLGQVELKMDSLSDLQSHSIRVWLQEQADSQVDYLSKSGL